MAQRLGRIDTAHNILRLKINNNNNNKWLFNEFEKRALSTFSRPLVHSSSWSPAGVRTEKRAQKILKGTNRLKTSTSAAVLVFFE